MLKAALLSLVIVGGIFGTASRALGFDVTACGQDVPAGEIGVLTADLDCSAGEVYGVELDDNATLELNGFTIRGSATGIDGVECHSRCSVMGPGTITGFFFGIQADLLPARVSDVTITDCRATGIQAGRLRLERSTVTGCGAGDASSNGALVVNSKLAASDSTVSDNQTDGIRTGGANLQNVQVTGNTGFGVISARYSLPGIVHATGKVRARDSVIVGNATACSPDEVPCFDLQAYKARLRNTVIGTCPGCP